MQLEVELIQDERRLAAVADEWNALAGTVPFRRSEWLATWWRHFRRAGDELFVPAVYDRERRLVALAPWYLSRDGWHGRVLRFLGSGKVCSEYLSVLADCPVADQVVGRLASWLTHEASGKWDLLDFDGVASSDVVLARLADELSATGCRAFRRQREQIWRLTLPASWDELVGRLSKKRRAKIRAQEREFFESGRAKLQTADDARGISQGLDVLHRLHQARRSSLGEAGCFALPQFEGFLAESALRFQRLGRLRLQWLEVDRRPGAVEFDLLGGDALFYYQTGIEPGLAEISPGWLLQAASLKRAIAEGCRYFDFLRGDEAYKSTWGAQPEPLVQFRIAARRPLARLRHKLWRAALEGKNHWQSTKNWAVATCGKKAC
ncbi:MAG TPA: GNAT family N-acetyltransferase [Pirellulales bacterium]|nr:GNAT family N-acetyltransferase [Pirellulales bacterium]